MNDIKLGFFISFLVLIISCSASKKLGNKSFNGEYRAEVKCINLETGNSTTYTLRVRAINNELVQICWINGGYKDVSQYNPSAIGKKGYCEFTSEKGIKYQVKIKGKALSFIDSSLSEEDMDEEKWSNYNYYFDDEDLDEYPIIE